MTSKPFVAHASAKAPATAEAAASSRVREVTSDELFRNAHEVVIVHHKVEYRLRITRQDKLILTK